VADDAIESVDQVEGDTPQVEAAVPDESTDIVAEVVADVEGSVTPETVVEDAPEAEEPVTEPDVSTLSVSELRERYPDVAKALENAGAQAREAQLRREAGSKEETRKRVAALKARLAEVPDGDTAGLDFMWDNAYANAQSEVMRTMARTAIESFNPGAEERQALETVIDSLDGDAVTRYAAQMVSLAADRVGRRSVYEQSVEDIPADSPLAKSIHAAKQAFHEAETKAAALEAKPKREPAPTVTGGRVAPPAGEIDPVLVKLEQQGNKALTDDERLRARELLGLRPGR